MTSHFVSLPVRTSLGFMGELFFLFPNVDLKLVKNGLSYSEQYLELLKFALLDKMKILELVKKMP